VIGVQGKGLSDGPMHFTGGFSFPVIPTLATTGAACPPSCLQGLSGPVQGFCFQQSGRPGMQAVVFLASVSAAVVKVNTSPPVFVREASEGGTEPLSPI